MKTEQEYPDGKRVVTIWGCDGDTADRDMVKKRFLDGVAQVFHASRFSSSRRSRSRMRKGPDFQTANRNRTTTRVPLLGDVIPDKDHFACVFFLRGRETNFMSLLRSSSLRSR